jgi:hypothetical protein
MAQKLEIKKVLTAVDQKNYNFYDTLTDEEKKSFSPFILMRYTANTNASRDIQEWFVEITNEMVNKHFTEFGKEDTALLWKLYAATGIGGKFYHPYLLLNRKEKISPYNIEGLLCELHPTMKMSDIKFLASIMDKNDCDELFEQMGLDENQRKKYEQ